MAHSGGHNGVTTRAFWQRIRAAWQPVLAEKVSRTLIGVGVGAKIAAPTALAKGTGRGVRNFGFSSDPADPTHMHKGEREHHREHQRGAPAANTNGEHQREHRGSCRVDPLVLAHGGHQREHQPGHSRKHQFEHQRKQQRGPAPRDTEPPVLTKRGINGSTNGRTNGTPTGTSAGANTGTNNGSINGSTTGSTNEGQFPATRTRPSKPTRGHKLEHQRRAPAGAHS